MDSGIQFLSDILTTSGPNWGRTATVTSSEKSSMAETQPWVQKRLCQPITQFPQAGHFRELWVNAVIKDGSRQTSAEKASLFFLPQHPAKLPSPACLCFSLVQFLTLHPWPPFAPYRFCQLPPLLTPHPGNTKTEQVQAQHDLIPICYS